MNGELLIKGVLLGISVAAPVGPIGLLCIRRSIEGGMRLGLSSGLGVALADATYAGITAFGLVSVTQVLTSIRVPLFVVGSVVLVWLGLKTFFKSSPIPRDQEQTKEKTTFSSLFAVTAGTFLLTLTNPATILSFVALFSGLGLAVAGRGAFETVFGVFVGSSLWWLVLTAVVGLVRKRLSPLAIRWINRCSGLLLMFLAILAMVQFAA